MRNEGFGLGNATTGNTLAYRKLARIRFVSTEAVSAVDPSMLPNAYKYVILISGEIILKCHHSLAMSFELRLTWQCNRFDL